MNITEMPVYLRPLIECKADVEHLIALCDERYIFNKLGWLIEIILIQIYLEI